MPVIKANGIDLFYDLTGPDGAPVVVFANSLGATVEMWDGVVRALAGHYRCLRYDMRGHGRSQIVTDDAAIDDLADDLAGLLDALAVERAHVVGLSLGGMTAQAFALRHPRRVLSLALLATSSSMAPGDTWRERAALVERDGLSAIVDITMERWFTPPFRAREPGAVEKVRRLFLANDAHGYAACCRIIGKLDLTDRLAAIDVPTLVVAGAQDPATPPAMSEAIARHIPGGELVVLEPAAHLLAVERVEDVAALLASFLARHGGNRPAAAPDLLAKGMANRKSQLGVAHVQRSLGQANAFNRGFQEFITRVAWGEVWGDPTLPPKVRSMLTLAITIALNRPDEFKLHCGAALRNGMSLEELRALIQHAAIYAGVPAANSAFHWAAEVIAADPSRETRPNDVPPAQDKHQ